MFFNPWKKLRLSGFQNALVLSLVLHVIFLFVFSVIQHSKIDPKNLEFVVTLQVHRQEAQQEVAPQVNEVPPPKPAMNRPIKKTSVSKLKPLNVPSAKDFSITTTPEIPETVEAPVKPVVEKPAAPAAVPTKPLNSQILDKSAVANYSDLIANHVSQFKYYPRMAVEHHWQGEALMLLAGPKLRVGLATNHLPLKDVPKAMTQPLILRKLAIFAEGLRNIYGITHPKIAVCGLNPHCGDRGLFGSEEIEIIRPAIEAFQNNFAWTTVSGPLPADTVFHSAAQGLFDGVLAMYHDQGLGPLKTIHFDTAVNVSVGLRNLRVSPDHGPAASLYGKGTASMKSFTAAFDLCEKWLEQHGANS